MTEEQLLKWAGMVGNVPVRDVASAAIAHACEAGQVVPAAKVTSLIEEARAFARIEGQAKGYFRDRNRDMAIAINVRAACHANTARQVSNEELETLIDLAK